MAASFQTFFEGWLLRQEQLLNELVGVEESTRRWANLDENATRDLIERVLTHYQEYFAEKSRMANGNVFLAFMPTWFTPFEKTFLWIAGFKPGLVCRLTMSHVDGLTEDQIQRIQNLSRETKRQEKSLSEAMAKIQESVASPPLVDFLRRHAGASTGFRQPLEGEIHEASAPIESLKSAMESVLRDADGLRMRTAENMVAILTSFQNVKLFAVAARLQFRIRTLGIQKEAEWNCRSDGDGLVDADS